MKKLSTKIAFIIFSFAVLATSILTIFLFVNSENIVEKYAGEYQSSIARSISASASSFVKNTGRPVKEADPSILNVGDGFRVFLISNDGEIITSNIDQEIGKRFESSLITKLASSGASAYAELPAFDGKGLSFYGIAKQMEGGAGASDPWTVVVEKDHNELYGPIRNAITLMVAVIALLIFGSAAGAVFFTQTSISDPLNKIIEAIRKVPQGGLYEAPELKSVNEIAQLDIAFRSTFDELKQLRASLESRVSEKTTELEKIIKETALQNENLENTKRAMINILEDARELEGFITNEKNKAEAIIASMGEGLIMVDKDYKITLTNQITENILGLPREKIIGSDIKNVFQATRKNVVLTTEERPISRVLKTGETIISGVGDELYWKTATKEFPVALIASPVKDSSSNEILGAVIIFRDITDDKRLNDAKTNFISVASHQLRTPLTSMRWFSEMLLDGDAGKLEEEQVHFVQRIQDSAERMVNLVNLLLQIARIEAGRIMVEPVPTSFKDLTTEVAESIALTLKAKLQTVEIKTTPENMPKISMDKDIVWQVVQNLLTNANRYGAPKSVIKVNISQNDGEIVYSVHNEGIGIPEKQKDRIFEKFFRADNAVKAVPEGSGLGLSLVRSIVDGWGGKVWFESKEGKGATFFFTIPKKGMEPKKGEVKLSI